MNIRPNGLGAFLHLLPTLAVATRLVECRYSGL